MNNIMLLTKVCTICNKEKPLDGFYIFVYGRLGRETLCKECKKEYRRKNKKHFYDYYRNRDLKRKYGITYAEKIELAKLQNYQCGICHIELEDDLINNPGNVCIDHSHNNNIIRGILCNNCNSVIGTNHFSEDPHIIKNAIKYLENYNQGLLEDIRLLEVVDNNKSELIKSGYKKCKRCLQIKDMDAFRKGENTCRRCANLWLFYKITEYHYNYMLNKQNNKCSICNYKHIQNGKQAEILHVDHDKNNNFIRGLLCKRCNTGLGMAKHSINILNNMINYLEKEYVILE